VEFSAAEELAYSECFLACAVTKGLSFRSGIFYAHVAEVIWPFLCFPGPNRYTYNPLLSTRLITIYFQLPFNIKNVKNFVPCYLYKLSM